MRLIKLITFVFCVHIFSISACDEKLIQEELATFTSANGTGLSVLISKNGETLCDVTLGSANIELSVPLNTHHIFEIGSLTKQFTAVGILLLAQDNKLALTDPISKYIEGIEGIETAKGEVTIAHLLSHTSGLVDPINTPEFLATKIQETISFEQLIDLFKNDHWQYQPGERQIYTNAGYSLLSHIIETVAKMSYQDYLQKKIWRPLNMADTHQNSFSIVPNKVTGYTFDGNAPRHHDYANLAWAYGAADLLSTPRDLSLFTHGLMTGKLLNKKHLELLLTPVRLSNGVETNGSFTYSFQQLNNQQIIHMSGSTLGYSSHSIYLPNNNVFIVVLNNSDGVNGGGWSMPSTVASKLLAHYLSVPLPHYHSVTVSEKTATALVGNYRLNEDTIRRLRYEDGRFYYQRNEGPEFIIVPMENNQFYFEDTLDYLQIINIGESEQSMALYTIPSNKPELAKKILSKP